MRARFKKLRSLNTSLQDSLIRNLNIDLIADVCRIKRFLTLDALESIASVIQIDPVTRSGMQTVEQGNICVLGFSYLIEVIPWTLPSLLSSMEVWQFVKKDKSLTNNVTEVCVRNTLFVQLCTSTKPSELKSKAYSGF